MTWGSLKTAKAITIDRIPKLPPDNYFLVLTDSCLYIYGPFGSRTLLSGSRKGTGNICLLKSKPKDLF